MSCPEDLVAHMRRVLIAERDLHDLAMNWRLIESSAAIGCPREVAPILPTLAGTRERFEALQSRLIDRMAAETLAQRADDLAGRAGSAIDILVRNLYERTADVGFLASDEPVQTFCAAPAGMSGPAAAALRARLAEYQAKYTVYDDILLCAPDGRILLRLAEDEARPATRDPVLAQALQAPGFIERFGDSDLAADGQGAALLYAHRIVSADGGLAGVLVLRFRFMDEMAGLFRAAVDARQACALMLLDAEGRVIASSDEAHVPRGARLACADTADVQSLVFAGREYLGVVRCGTPYQGYPGPAGWRMVAMVPLLTAFNLGPSSGTADPVATAVAQPELQAIRSEAEAINQDLRRVVWNGRLMARGDTDGRLRLQAVLHQVSDAGRRTRSRLEAAIRDLGATARARAQLRAGELARLAADILDRNLYERANDCRWWALSPVLREALAAEGGVTAQGRADMAQVLAHIHRLYTVYSRLVVFDAQGRVQAVSGGGADAGSAAPVPPTLLRQVLELPSPQAYAVTPFAEAPWSGDGPTYTYLAAIRHPDDPQRRVGGLAIVFHAARELPAILHDLLGERAGWAAFVDAQGQVLAQWGEMPDTPAVRAAPDGSVCAAQGQAWVCAHAHGQGYREYGRAGGGDPAVAVRVALPLGPLAAASSVTDAVLHLPAGLGRESTAVELAVFRVGADWYALPGSLVEEAHAERRRVQTPGDAAASGLMEVGPPSARYLVRVVDAAPLLGQGPVAPAAGGTVLVLRDDPAAVQGVLGLRVDEVMTVLDVPAAALQALPGGEVGLVTHLLRGQDAQGQARLVQWIDAARLLARCGVRPAVADAVPA